MRCYAVPPTVALTEADGAGDGSTGGTATFTASGGDSGQYATVNYTVSGPGVSDGELGLLDRRPEQFPVVLLRPGVRRHVPTVHGQLRRGNGDRHGICGASPRSRLPRRMEPATAAPAARPRSPPAAETRASTLRSITRSAAPASRPASSVSLTGGQSSSLSFSYNPEYGGASQQYTVSSDVGTVTVTVYAVPVAVPPTVALTETDGAGDGSSGGSATFTASGGTAGQYDTVNYTVSGPGVSGSSSVYLTGGQSSSLSFSYDPDYGGASQQYTVSSDVGTVTVTVYEVVPLTVALTETDGAGDGSSGGSATFTASGGTAGQYDTVNYTVSGPGVSQSSSVSLTGGQSSSLSFAYNPAYGGGSQQYTVSFRRGNGDRHGVCRADDQRRGVVCRGRLLFGHHFAGRGIEPCRHDDQLGGRHKRQPDWQYGHAHLRLGLRRWSDGLPGHRHSHRWRQHLHGHAASAGRSRASGGGHQRQRHGQRGLGIYGQSVGLRANRQ